MMESVQLDELDQYLSSDESPEDCMMLSDLDGLLHGVICSPSPISSDVWMTAGLGAEPKELPDWVVNTLTDRYMEIAQGLAHDPMVVEPIFWQAKAGHLIAMDWCEGFMKAVSLNPKEWLRLSESGSDGHLMTPILLHMIDEEGNSMMGITQDQLDKALDQASEVIPDTVARIYLYWQQ